MNVQKIKALISKSFIRNEFFHAYIIEDTQGKDSKDMAKFLAATSLCDINAGFPCGSCINCKKIYNGNHENLLWIGHDGSIKVEEILELQKQLRNKTYSGKCKVAVIEKAETITPPAQNKLLKTLEEPPEDTLIVLLTSNKDSLPATIVSRCIVFSINGFDSKAIIWKKEEYRHVREVLEAIKKNKQYFIISKLIEGDMESNEIAIDFLEKIKLCVREDLLTGKIEISTASIIIGCAEVAYKDIKRKLRVDYVLKNMILTIELKRNA